MIGLRGLPATWGGVEHHVEELGARLVERGHEVTVYCRSNYTDPAARRHRGMRLEVHRAVERRGLEALSHSLLAAGRTLNGRHDIVHFHAVGPGVAAPLPRYLSRSAVVQTIHGLDADRAKWGGGARLLLTGGTWMSAHVPHATVTVSRTLQQHYRDRYGRSATYIPNGVSAPVHVGAELLRERFGLEPGSYLLYVGRLVPEKAADVLLEAFAQLHDDVRLVIAGGSSDTAAFTERLRGLADRDPRVLMPGYVFGAELAALYSHARAFVLPSLLEGLPLTLLEAISYGLPVVVTSIPPHLEVVGAEGPGARLAPPGDVLALQEAVSRSLRDPAAERAAAQERSREVLVHYDWDRATDLLEELYLSLVDAPGAHEPDPRRA